MLMQPSRWVLLPLPAGEAASPAQEASLACCSVTWYALHSADLCSRRQLSGPCLSLLRHYLQPACCHTACLAAGGECEAAVQAR